MKRKLLWLLFVVPFVVELFLLMSCTPPRPPQPPEEPHDPLCQGTVVCDCWHRPPGEEWQFIKCEPPPPPTDPCAAVLCGPGTKCVDGKCVAEPPTPPQACTLPLDGTLVAKAYKLYPRVMDFTPLITNAERCRAVGFGDRISCPTAPDDNPQRYPCEVKLIGGPGPIWELNRDSGNLGWSYEDAEPLWKARISGMGKGRIRACYPNLKACSPWIELSYEQ